MADNVNNVNTKEALFWLIGICIYIGLIIWSGVNIVEWKWLCIGDFICACLVAVLVMVIGFVTISILLLPVYIIVEFTELFNKEESHGTSTSSVKQSKSTEDGVTKEYADQEREVWKPRKLWMLHDNTRKGIK